MGSGQRSCSKKNETVDFFGVRNHQRQINVDVVLWYSIEFPGCTPLKSKHKNGKSSFSNWGYIFNGLFLLLLLLLLLWWYLPSHHPTSNSGKDIQRYRNRGEKSRRHGLKSGADSYGGLGVREMLLTWLR